MIRYQMVKDAAAEVEAARERLEAVEREYCAAIADLSKEDRRFYLENPQAAVGSRNVAGNTITEESLRVFLSYAKDAGNWSGSPMVGGNVGGSKEERGNLTQLKKAGLITTSQDRRDMFVNFTAAGINLAAQHGIDLEQ